MNYDSDCWWCEASGKCLNGANDVFKKPWAAIASKCASADPTNACPASGLALWGPEQCPGIPIPFTYKCSPIYYQNSQQVVLADGSPGFFCSAWPCCEFEGDCPAAAASASPIARGPGASAVVFSLLLSGAAGDPSVLLRSLPLARALRAACAALLGSAGSGAVDVAAFSILALSNASDPSAAAIVPGAALNGAARRLLPSRAPPQFGVGGGEGGSGRLLTSGSSSGALLRVDMAVDASSASIVANVAASGSVADLLTIVFANAGSVQAAFSPFLAALGVATGAAAPSVALTGVRPPNLAFSALPSAPPAATATSAGAAAVVATASAPAAAAATPEAPVFSSTAIAVGAAAVSIAAISVALAYRFFTLWRRAERTLPLPYGLDDDERAAAEASVAPPAQGAQRGALATRQPFQLPEPMLPPLSVAAAVAAAGGSRRGRPRPPPVESADGLGSPCDCAICLFTCHEPVVGLCGAHSFCRSCLRAHIAALKARGLPSTCPVCRGACQGLKDRLIINVALQKAIDERNAVQAQAQAQAQTQTQTQAQAPGARPALPGAVEENREEPAAGCGAATAVSVDANGAGDGGGAMGASTGGGASRRDGGGGGGASPRKSD